MNQDSLEPFELIAECLKKHGKSRAWLNTASSRFGLMPKPFRQKRSGFVLKGGQVKLGKDNLPILSKQGSLTFYPRGTAEYVEELIRQRDQENRSYLEIKELLKDKIQALNQVAGSGLQRDKRVKGVGFFYNYRAAIKICKKFDLLEESQLVSNQWEKLIDDRRRLAEEYYAVALKMQQILKDSSHLESYREAEEKRNRLGDKLDFIHAIMETTINHVLSFLKAKHPEGGEHMKHWFDAVSEIEKESTEG